MMVSLTFYGGVNEIGGNKILLESGGNRIFLDFGMSFTTAKKYFDEWLQPRKLNGIGDFLEVGLLPDLEGLYRTDYLRHIGRKEHKLKFDAMFLTHAHSDHANYMHHLHESMPVYSSKETFNILESIEETGLGTWSEFTNWKETFRFALTKEGKLKRLQGEDAKKQRNINIMEKPVELGDCKVTAYPVNHSIPGAAAFIIETPKGKIAYTGDLRFHGYGGHLTEQFVKAAGNADYLICEGTRINEGTTITEEQVAKKISEHVTNTKGIVLANWPIRDIDRLKSFYIAAKENERKLVISTKQANMLEKLNKSNSEYPSLDDENIRIFVTRKYWGMLGKKTEKRFVLMDYAKWEQKYLDHKNAISYKELNTEPSNYLVRCDYFDMTELIDIKPKEGSRYIRSACEPFDDESMMDTQRVNNWLQLYHLYPADSIHCSGHAPGSDIKRIIAEIAPKKLIPIHTEHPEAFLNLGPEVILPEYGKKIEL